MILTAGRVQELIGVADNVVVAHGYDFDRNTLDIFFQEGKIVKATDQRYGKPILYCQSVIFEPKFFTAGVKRWYASGFNERLRGLFETFSDGLSFTDGGKYPDTMFLPEKGY